MNPKLAYIDYTTYGTLMVMELRQRGIVVAGGKTLDDFLSRNKMEDFPVLLYHAGVKQQHLLREIPKRFPHLTMGGVTSPTSGGDYKGSNFTIFCYDSVDAIEIFVREHQ